MAPRAGVVAAVLAVCLTALVAQSAELTVVNAGPIGPLEQLQQAGEVRVIFSEPMVALGRIPENPTPSWFRITPALRGTFRWSGTSILIFTPDPAALPYATDYRVTIESTTESAAGRRLRAPFSFAFQTPAAQVTSVRWARRNGRFDDPVTIELRFNHPVRTADVLAHLTVRFHPHAAEVPQLSPEERARLLATDPDGARLFDAKVAEARRQAARTDAVAMREATDWDRRRFPPADGHVMLETTSAPPPGTSLEVTLDASMPSPQGPAVPGRPQTSVLPLPAAFFAGSVQCRRECTPSGYNPVPFTTEVSAARFAAALTATDITDPAREQAVAKRAPGLTAPRDIGTAHGVEDAGFDPQPPARTWALRLDPTLIAEDGQTLGYPWIGVVQNWNHRAFTSFGDGHGVWESSSGAQLPFYARNYQSLTEWITRVAPADLMPLLRRLDERRFQIVPPGNGRIRRLTVAANEIQSHGLDLSSALGDRRTGFVWAGIQPAEPIARAKAVPRTASTIVQVTNLGITVKDSPQSTLVFVTSLDTGDPVAGAAVSIVNAANTTLWRGTTSGDGLAMAPALPLRTPNNWYELSFVVLAEKDGDVAYAASNWHEGIMPWAFGYHFSLHEDTDILRGSVFTDRGVYKPGEAVQIKAIVRLDTPNGIRLLPAGSTVAVTLRDARNKDVDTRTITINRWSSAEWAWTVPADSTLGQYRLDVRLPGRKPAPTDANAEVEEDNPWLKQVGGGFLVAAYRRPDFQVTTTLAADTPFAGGPLAASVAATYLFGGTMAGRPVKWSLTRAPMTGGPPAAIAERFPREQFTFGYYPDWRTRNETRVAGEDAALGATGRLSLALATDRDADLAQRYTFEADVEDLSRQHIAHRTSVVVHPASFYLGVRRSDEFSVAGQTSTVQVVAAGLDGEPVAGVTATAALLRVQWNSVRRATGGGFYEWDTERLEIPAGEWTVTTAATPIPITIAIPEGGSYVLRVTARDSAGRRARTDLSLYAMGVGYTAWERFDHNRIALEPERKTWKPSETARLMIKSPWERATALLTVEREGIRQHRRFTLTSTQQTVDVPITEADIPNVFVSVLLIRGRTSADVGADGSDPGKPGFRLGYAELFVADDTKRLAVTVSADRDEYRPTTNARVSVAVTDAEGRAAASEVTLWAVDQGVLALTEYSAPDLASAVYAKKALQVISVDSRQRLISRRVLTPKGGDEGGGGGAEMNARSDFRPLAFWLGSVETDRNGRATKTVSLPDSLTTYRIMAVAGDRASRFGSADASLRVTKPVTLLPVFPRFLALTDRAAIGALVSNTQATATDAVVTIRSLDPSILQINGAATSRLSLAAAGTSAVRFDAIARATGLARVRVSVSAGRHNDAFETILPVVAVARMETTAAFGETTDRRVERLALPAGVLPDEGGLTVELASTALVGLGEGARYLADYPFGCAEQKASAALALALAADLGEAFSMGALAPASYRARAASLLAELPRFQCADGGFGYWPGNCRIGHFYLTSYVLQVMRIGAALGVAADASVTDRALAFLQAQMREAPPAQVQWIPAWSASTAFAVKVLTEYEQPQDANVTRLLDHVDRMPAFAMSYLADAMASTPTRHPRYGDVIRRLTNAISVEGDRAHVQELESDELAWLWNSNVRSTALVLEGLVRRGDAAALVPALVRGLLLARRNGRWGNTQENATALTALVGYFRAFEADPPNFSATVTIGERRVGSATFRQRSSTASAVRLAMPDLLRHIAAGTEADLSLSRAGTGRLYYTARLQYVPATPSPVSDQGIRIERRFERVVERGESPPPSTTFAAGDLVRVTLAITLPQERRYVAVSDPLAAGFEAVDGWFRTTAADLARDASVESGGESFMDRWRRGGFDHVEKHDDRVTLFATRLAEGRHEFSYVVRATTAGVFTVAGTWAEEMYAPEVNGRSAPATVTVK
jgi:uncharacterized protein YfaS (alpha-2-macroglobulin family)